MAVPDRFFSFPDNMKGRIRKTGQHFKRAGEVTLVHVRKDNRADVNVCTRIVLHFASLLPILIGRSLPAWEVPFINLPVQRLRACRSTAIMGGFRRLLASFRQIIMVMSKSNQVGIAK